MLTKTSFTGMNEASLREEVVIPLLQKMGYNDVFLWHGGSGEQGKDVVGWKSSELGRRENLAVVAKAIKTSGQAKLDKGTAAEIQTQIRQCFGKSYTAPGSLEDQWVHRVWVVSNKKISKETQDAVKSSLNDNPLMVRNVEFIDGDKLWGLVAKHLPTSMMPLIQELQKYSQSDSHYVQRITIGPDKAEVALLERFPGAAQEKPIEIKPQFVNDAAAAAFEEVLRHYHETGEAIEVPADLIQKVEIPDFLKTMLGIDVGTEPSQINLSIVPPPFPNGFPVRLHFLCEDGDQYVCEHIVLRAVNIGIKEATIVSEEGEQPFRFSMKLTTSEGADTYDLAQFNLQTRKLPTNALQHWEWLRLNTCLSKPWRLLIKSVEFGFTFFESPYLLIQQKGPKPELVEFYKRLALIQEKAKTPIYVPERNLTRREIQI